MSQATVDAVANIEGVLLVNKKKGKSSFSIVHELRKILGVKKIGHAGTLDPFATGVMVMLVGRNYTRLSDQFLCDDKEYVAELRFGISTDSFDCEGEVTGESDLVPTREELEAVIAEFQGTIMQVPPMFSAKKIKGKKLYELARKGQEVERQPVPVTVQTTLLSYDYPHAIIRVAASKGTYIRSIGHEIGQRLACGAHLTELQRVRSGGFSLDQCVDGDFSQATKEDLIQALRAAI